MTISTALQALFPAARPGIDYIVRDDSDGRGPRIIAWNLPQPQPNPAAIAAAVAIAEAKRVALEEIATIEADIGIPGKMREWLLDNIDDAKLKARLREVDNLIRSKRPA